MGLAQWIEVISALFFVLCFYFTLTFIEYLRNGEERLMKQAKVSAIICLTICLALFLAVRIIY